MQETWKHMLQARKQEWTEGRARSQSPRVLGELRAEQLPDRRQDSVSEALHALSSQEGLQSTEQTNNRKPKAKANKAELQRN